jgi:hypothetical protein
MLSAMQQPHRCIQNRSSWLPQPSDAPSARCSRHRKPKVAARAVSSDDVAIRVFAAAAAATLSLSTLFGAVPQTAAAPPPPALAVLQQYEQQVQRLHHKKVRSNLPTANEAAALQMLLDPDMFTPEAAQGRCGAVTADREGRSHTLAEGKCNVGTQRCCFCLCIERSRRQLPSQAW